MSNFFENIRTNDKVNEFLDIVKDKTNKSIQNVKDYQTERKKSPIVKHLENSVKNNDSYDFSSLVSLDNDEKSQDYDIQSYLGHPLDNAKRKMSALDNFSHNNFQETQKLQEETLKSLKNLQEYSPNESIQKTTVDIDFLLNANNETNMETMTDKIIISKNWDTENQVAIIFNNDRLEDLKNNSQYDNYINIHDSVNDNIVDKTLIIIQVKIDNNKYVPSQYRMVQKMVENINNGYTNVSFILNIKDDNIVSDVLKNKVFFSNTEFNNNILYNYILSL